MVYSWVLSKKTNQACAKFAEFTAKMEQQTSLRSIQMLNFSAFKLMVAQTVPRLKDYICGDLSCTTEV